MSKSKTEKTRFKKVLFDKGAITMNNSCVGCSGLGLTLTGAIAGLLMNPALADVVSDNTLPNNSQVTTEAKTINIDGGTRLSGSKNLFHSFQQFSVPQGYTAHFRNPEDVQNIITRVTGNSVSHIDGILKANGAANLFLINPHGIKFGAGATLDIGGSFIGSTASSMNFQNGTKFSATTAEFTPLLAVSVPVGLQFGTTATPIVNQSQAVSLVNSHVSSGLQVNSGNTIALVGGDITLDGGMMTAESGRIELASVGPNSLVSLNPENGWSLGYNDTQSFRDVRLIQNGNNPSMLDTSGSLENPSGSIHIRGNLVQVSGNADLRNFNFSSSKGGDIEIYARRIEAKEGSQISTTTLSSGSSGNLTLNASESIELIGVELIDGNYPIATGLFTTTANVGSAGDISITTPILRIKDGATVSAGYGASENLPVSLAESSGGNITIRADIVEIAGFVKKGSIFSSQLSASTTNYGNAGKIDITTKELIVRDRGRVTVVNYLSESNILEIDPSQVGTPGELNVNARSIVLDDKAQLSATSGIGQGGSIALNVQNLLLMLDRSQITASAGTSGGAGNGGNITINAPNGFVVATPLGNNDITANARSGSGGQITINAQSIFGLVPRTRVELVNLLGTQTPLPQNLPTSDITAFSEQNPNPTLNGIIEINTPDVDPSKGLSELAEETVDPSGLIDRGCSVSGGRPRSNFTFTGRGGLVSSPLDPLAGEGVLTSWIVLEERGQNLASGMQGGMGIPQTTVVAKDKQDKQNSNSFNHPELIVEAQSWTRDANGKVVLVAQAPTVEPHSPGLNSASCAVP